MPLWQGVRGVDGNFGGSGLQPHNGERMRNLLRGREALPAQPEKPFSARAGGPGRGADVRIVQRSDLT